MTTRNIAGHTGRSKLIDGDPIAVEVTAARIELERQDQAFIARLAAAIRAGKESAAGCIGRSTRH
jgi:hypothetical protein